MGPRVSHGIHYPMIDSRRFYSKETYRASFNPKLLKITFSINISKICLEDTLENATQIYASSAFYRRGDILKSVTAHRINLDSNSSSMDTVLLRVDLFPQGN